MKTEREVRIEMEGGGVSGMLVRPAESKWLLVLGHGAGAWMHHPFMSALAEELARVGVATLRYQFPYMEARRKVPDKPAVLTATVAAAMRAEHLEKVAAPMLFLQGTRDELADLKLLKPICKKLGERATLHVIETADHSFHMLKKSGRSDEEVLRELAETAVSWAERIEGMQSKLAQNPVGEEQL